MNITKKDWFCYQCSLQFNSNHIYTFHLKLMHKDLIETNSVKNELSSNELACDKKSDSNNQIALDQNVIWIQLFSQRKIFEIGIKLPPLPPPFLAD